MPENEKKSRLDLPEPTLAVAGLLFAWGLLISQTRHHWGGESYYNFGFFVPPLAIWLFLRNLSKIGTRDEGPGTRDEGPGTSVHAGRSENTVFEAKASTLRANLGQKGLEFWTIVACLLSLVPLILFHALSEVNPFWRVPLWAQGCCLSAFTLILLFRYYGWAGIRAGLFPLIFLLTMIPWPFRFEVWIVQTLTEIVTGLAVQGLHFLSYPVEMVGNTLRLGDISIGVNEACSGIRSLQALFMVTLFLGSLFGQSLVPRLLSLAALPLVVIVVNTARAIFLSVQTIVNGNEAYEKWHDPAGYIAFGVSMLVIYATIELLNIGGSGSMDTQRVDLKKIASVWKGTRTPGISLVYLLLPISVFVVVESWFRYHEMLAPEQKDWELALPEPDDPDYRYAEYPKSVKEALGFSYGYRFFHGLSNDTYVEVYYYGYGEDNKLSSVSSYGHAPTICMEASGAQLIQEYDPKVIEAGELRIPVRHYLFRLPRTGENLNVFWTVWENRNMDIPADTLQELTARAAWIQLRHGRRDYSRKVLLTSLAGIKDPRRAREEMGRLLSEWINPVSD